MADQDDVRRIALSLPGARQEAGRFAFSVESKGKLKGFVWAWLERVHPKKARVPSTDVIAVRVRDLAEKAALVAGDPERFFTEPHYNGYPAVLVRLRTVTEAQLRTLISDAWRCQAPPHLRDDRGSAPSGVPRTDSKSSRAGRSRGRSGRQTPKRDPARRTVARGRARPGR
jgi:hypothetical protein